MSGEMTSEQKAYIDTLSHYDLLYAIRFAKVGDPRFQGAKGKYWLQRRGEMQALDPLQAVRDSKEMGW